MALPKHIVQALEETLSDLGLHSTEIKVFCHLFENTGAERISTIAQRTKLNRTTLYGILKSLGTEGLVSSVEERGILTYRALEPGFLIDSIQRKKVKLSDSVKKIQELTPQIEQARRGKARDFPKIQFFDGVEGIKQAYEDTIRNNPSKKIYGFTGPEEIFRSTYIDMGWVEEYIKRRTKAGVTWYSIATDSKESRAMKARDASENRVTKILPPGFKHKLEFGTYGDKVIIASFSHDHPLGILIEDKEIAQSVKTLFDYINSTLKE